MGNTTANPKGKMKLMPMGGIQDENGDYVMESFIIRACNSHEALVALAERVAQAYKDTDAPIGEVARAALKLAKP